MKVRERLTSARVPVRSPASSGSGLTLAMDLGASGEEGVVDEVQGFTEKTTAWSACSIGSWCDGEGRLEVVCASKCFGRA
jgi:hypothetical protein